MQVIKVDIEPLNLTDGVGLGAFRYRCPGACSAMKIWSAWFGFESLGSLNVEMIVIELRDHSDLVVYRAAIDSGPPPTPPLVFNGSIQGVVRGGYGYASFEDLVGLTKTAMGVVPLPDLILPVGWSIVAYTLPADQETQGVENNSQVFGREAAMLVEFI